MIKSLKRRSCALLAGTLLFFLAGCGVEDAPQDDGSSGGGQRVEVSGTLTDSSGKPLAEVQVSLVSSGSSTTTDSAGAFTFAALEITGLIQFIVQGDGYSAQSNELSLAEGETAIAVLLTLGADLQSLQAERSGDSPAPDPTAAAGTPQPSPTAESVPAQGYDSNGNTRDFGIPSPYIGNVSRGRRKWSERCAACHASLVGRNLNFSALKRTIAAAPMNITMHDASLADIVAYLRR